MSNLKFKTPPSRGKGKRYYCGPFAICAITGKPYETSVKPAINDYRNRPLHLGILGMTNGQVQGVLRQYGYWLDREFLHTNKYDREDYDGKVPTLAHWMRKRKGYQLKSLYLVEVTHHYVLVQGRKFIDNHTEKPVFIRQAPHRRARVRRVWEVKKM